MISTASRSFLPLYLFTTLHHPILAILFLPCYLNFADFSSGLTAPPFHSFISHLTPTFFDLYTPTNPWPIILTPLIALTAGGLLYGLWPFLLPLYQSRLIWGTVSILMILTFTSGYMWNRIKGAPYVTVDQSGRTSWIAGGYQNQLGLESQVVAGTCTLLPAKQKPIELTGIRRAARLHHHRFDGLRPRPIVPSETAHRGLPMARDAHRSLQPAHEALPNQERRVPVLHIVLGRVIIYMVAK